MPWVVPPVNVAIRLSTLLLETGENAVVYRDGETQSWFTQRA